MHHLVLIFTVAALLGDCRSATISRHSNLPDIDNNIEPSVIPPKHALARKFITITKKPAAVNQHEPGTTLELTCEAIAAPAPTVKWFKNDAPVYEHDMESNELFSDSGPTSLARVTSTLLVSKTRNQDQYTCLVAAGANTAKASTMVFSTGGTTDLTERSKLVPLSPRILVSYKIFVDTIGTNVILPCKAKGHPRPHVTWKDSKGVDVKKNPRMKVLRSGELLISPLRWSDMGEFTCHAQNVFGGQTAPTFVYPAKAG